MNKQAYFDVQTRGKRWSSVVYVCALAAHMFKKGIFSQCAVVIPAKNTTADPSLEKSTEIISEDLGSDLAMLKY